MSWVAVGVVGAGAVTSIVGGSMSSSAAKKAAKAQAREAAAQRAMIMQQGQENQRKALDLAEATPQELAALSRSYGSAENALNREEKLLSAIDPSLMEASQQALKLLRGETADINKPMTDLRNSQRQSLINSLRSQYGPGAESTSIGQRILQSFDMETNSMFAQNQSNALNQAFGIASSDLGGRQQRGIAGLMGVGSGYSALQERKLNTQLNTGNSILAALSGTSADMIDSAGARYTGQGLQGQQLAGIGNTAMQLGAMYGGGAFGGGGSKSSGKLTMSDMPSSSSFEMPALGSSRGR